MIHYLLDTNSLLRYLLNDIPSQASQTHTLLQKSARLEVKVTLPTIVLAELVFTLTKSYSWPKDQVSTTLLQLVISPSLQLENRSLAIIALNLFQKYTLSFVDCLLLAEAQTTHSQIFTFDKKLKKLHP